MEDSCFTLTGADHSHLVQNALIIQFPVEFNFTNFDGFIIRTLSNVDVDEKVDYELSVYVVFYISSSIRYIFNNIHF